MKFILDCPNINDITENENLHLVDGFDLNSKNNNALPVAEKIKIIEKLSKKIAKDKLIFIGLSSDDIKEAIELSKVNKNIVISFYANNISLCNNLISQGITTAVSPVLSLSQAIFFAKSGVHFIFTPLGKLEDMSINGIELISEIRVIIDNYPDFYTQIISRSVRNLIHINESAKVGSDAICLSNDMLKKMLNCPIMPTF